MKVCPQCNATFPDDDQFCSFDGKSLEDQTEPSIAPAYDHLDPLIGRVLKDTYKLEKWLGGGGMGVVYHARHTSFAKEFAVKILQPQLGSDPQLSLRFKIEAEAAAKVNHPNIVAVTDYGETADHLLFMVMEYVQGETLRTLLKREKRLSSERAIAIVKEIGQAVEAAHRLDIAHRDLKPENVMLQSVNQQQRVRVLDFGLAKLKNFETSLTRPGQLLGTPLYMPPEQWQAEEVDHRADIYALGVMLYEMLSGSLPFMASDLKVLYHKHMQEEPKPLYELCPEAGSALCQVVMRALSKKPEDRQQSIGELLENINLTLLQPVKTPPASIIQNETVFISYAKEDSNRVLPIAQALESSGIKVWLDREKIEGSASYGLRVVQAIKKCSVLMLMCSDAAMRSRNVKQEILLAWKHEKPILPALLERTTYPEQLEYWLEGWQWVEIANHPKDKWLPKIHQALNYENVPAADAPLQSDSVEPVTVQRFICVACGTSNQGSWIYCQSCGVQLPGRQVTSEATRDLMPHKAAAPPPLFRGLGAVPKSPRSDLAPTKEETQNEHSRQALAGLLTLAVFTDQLWPIAADYAQPTAPKFRGMGAPQDGMKRQYRLDGRVRLALEVERDSYLLLLNQGADGIIYCLCPSDFAPNSRIKAGRNYFPQSDSEYDAFVLTGDAGREHLLAILTDEPLGLNWMPTPDEPARILQPSDIDQLLALLRGLDADKWTALSTYFVVTE